MASEDAREDRSLSMRAVISAVKLKWPKVATMSTADLHVRVSRQASVATPPANSQMKETGDEAQHQRCLILVQIHDIS